MQISVTSHVNTKPLYLKFVQNKGKGNRRIKIKVLKKQFYNFKFPSMFTSKIIFACKELQKKK